MYIFGSSPDALQATKLAYDNFYARLAEGDRAARAAANQNAVQNQIAANREAASDVERSNALGYNFAQNQQQRSDQSRREAAQAYQFDVGTALEKRKLDQAAQAEADSLALAKLRQGEGDRATDYAKAQNAVASGVVKSTEDLKSKYPRLTELDVSQLGDYIAANNRTLFRKYAETERNAKAATAIASAERNALATPAVPSSWLGMRSGTPAGAPPAWDEGTAMETVTKKNRGLSKAMVDLTWDEDSQMFVPASEKPEGYEHFVDGLTHGFSLAPNATSAPAMSPTNAPGFRFPMPPPPPPNPRPAARRMPVQFYDRVNQLYASGVPKQQAIAQALREFAATP